MGLDAYLHARKYISRHDYSVPYNEDTGRTITPEYADLLDRMPADLDLYGDSGAVIELNVAYWRKAYAIHDWFADNSNFESNGEVWIHRETLEDLLDSVNQVLADHSKASELLPDPAYLGADTGYDEWYYDQLEYTQKALTHLLSNPAYDAIDFHYSASW